MAFGDQDLDRLSDQLCARVAEEPLGLRVHEDDPAVLADDHHRVGGRLEQPSKPGLDCLLLAEARDGADVADGDGDELGRTSGIRHDARGDVDVDAGAVLPAPERLERDRPPLDGLDQPRASVLAQLRRRDEVERSTEDLLALVTEDPLRPSTPEEDRPSRRDGD